MNRRSIRKINLWSFFLASLTIGCKQKSTSSDVKFELLGYTAGVTVYAQQQRIRVCGGGGDELEDSDVVVARDAANKWLDALKRKHKTAKAVAEIGCPGEITLNVLSQFSDPNQRSHVMPSIRPTINLLKVDKDTRLVNTLLHEMGHVFGVADTYLEPLEPKAGEQAVFRGCKPGQPDSVMCSATVSELSSDDIEAIQAKYEEVFPSSLEEKIERDDGKNGRWPTATEQPRPTIKKPIISSEKADLSNSGQLNCLTDFKKIYTNTSLTGVCFNHTSGLCYKYSNGAVQYAARSVTCQKMDSSSSGSGVVSSVQSNTHSSTDSQNTNTGLLDCNKDYTQIRTSNISGICVNDSSGYRNCYRYERNDVRYEQGSVTCP